MDAGFLSLLLAVFVASFLGSPHCVGMCGPLAILATVPTVPIVGIMDSTSRRPLLSTLLYHLGRLVGYLSLGMIAGSVGSVLDLGGQWLGLQRIAAMASGVTMIAMGGIMLLTPHAARLTLPIPGHLVHFLRRARASLDRLPVAQRGLGIGLLTTFLPCGWLYAFVITAAGSGGVLPGAAVLGAFWLGTVPALGMIGVSSRLLLARSYIPIFVALLFMATGTYNLLVRGTLPEYQSPVVAVCPTPGTPLPCCHRE